ncbi:MAG TPA: ferric reductase-like transmembrane domain-containing protein [Stellaceae bacterium]|nr:ferric reductase-like transmembrane domain-containing protein [Stellaceae bacterium]
MTPWRDRAGRFSPLKAACFAALFLPGIVLAEEEARGLLGARPITEMIHASGLWAIRLLLLSLAVTPARQVLRLPRLILLRRMIGVATFCYAVLHLALYAADKMYDIDAELSEILHRLYLAIGAGALALLLALAATSTDGMVARLGGKRWQALQRSVYLIAILASIHFFLQSKIDATEPTMMAGFLLWLMGYRALAWRGGTPLATASAALLLLSLGAALATALGEALYFGLFTGIPGRLVLAADLSLAAGPRPCWIVLAAGLAVTTAAALRRPAEPALTRPARP